MVDWWRIATAADSTCNWNIAEKFTDEQYTNINQSTAGHFDLRVFVNCLQVEKCCERRLFILNRNVLQLIDKYLCIAHQWISLLYQHNYELLQHHGTWLYIYINKHAYNLLLATYIHHSCSLTINVGCHHILCVKCDCKIYNWQALQYLIEYLCIIYIIMYYVWW